MPDDPELAAEQRASGFTYVFQRAVAKLRIQFLDGEGKVVLEVFP